MLRNNIKFLRILGMIAIVALWLLLNAYTVRSDLGCLTDSECEEQEEMQRTSWQRKA